MANLRCHLLCCALLFLFISKSVCFKPVIIVHGILDHASDMKDLASFITQAHPGTNITLIKLFEERDSFKPLWMQVSAMTEKIRPVMQDAKYGVHIIGFSQGGLTVRAILETMDDHNVDSFYFTIRPSDGPIWRFFYSESFQRILSLANYWNDPYHEDKNYEFNIFLPVVNNLNCSKFFNATVSKKFKENFLRIKNLVLIGGPDDGVITPWQSSHFGSYNTNLTVVDMKYQQVYLGDTFGLRTLDERGSIHQYTFSGVNHTSWHGTKKVFEEAIEPWLT
ncbi:holo-[acyl-carrier-protein] synthase [Desmophyllum pertusum]|uniref:palmitoyl-CoA hydrolase n=1 Tax=Desmophyllum pertusum TaxID=174260 RepID=A0A9W9Z890_9CNID|nr:holo-[acyl-carrier-protein] synthase [Desmophyllum pertusum]